MFSCKCVCMFLHQYLFYSRDVQIRFQFRIRLERLSGKNIRADKQQQISTGKQEKQRGKSIPFCSMYCTTLPTFVFLLQIREEETFDVIGQDNLLQIFLGLFWIGMFYRSWIGFGYRNFRIGFGFQTLTNCRIVTIQSDPMHTSILQCLGSW